MTLSYFCPGCRRKLQETQSASLIQEPPSLGDLNLCGHCGCLAVFKLNGLEEISPNEFDALHEDEKKDLRFAARSIVDQANRNNVQTKIQGFIIQP